MWAQPASSRVISIDGITLHLAQPMSMGQEWIGNREILKQLLACWLVIDERDLPLSPPDYRSARNRKNHAGDGRSP